MQYLREIILVYNELYVFYKTRLREETVYMIMKELFCALRLTKKRTQSEKSTELMTAEWQQTSFKLGRESFTRLTT